MTTSTYRDDLLTTQRSVPVSAGTAEKVAALHTELVLRFRSIVEQHRPGCAFVDPFPDVDNPLSQEVLVVPFRAGAAVVSCALVAGDRITLIVRTGEHAVVECVEDDRGIAALAARAELLLGSTVSGRVQNRRYEPY